MVTYEDELKKEQKRARLRTAAWGVFLVVVLVRYFSESVWDWSFIQWGVVSLTIVVFIRDINGLLKIGTKVRTNTEQRYERN